MKTLPVLVALLTIVPLALARGAVDPVVNGEFEVAAEALRPHACAATGPGIKVAPDGTGLPWLTTVDGCHGSAFTAAHWSHGSNVVFEDVDGDGDREARTVPGPLDPQVGSHTMWQAYPSPHQAFAGDFDHLAFRVEGGAIPSGARIVLSFSNTPVGDQTPWVGLFITCSLTLAPSALGADADGVVRVSPLEGTFRSTFADCDDQAAAWNAAAADADDRRAVLSGLRLVQHSYWGFSASAVVLDGVSIVGARTFAEAAAGV